MFRNLILEVTILHVIRFSRVFGTSYENQEFIGSLSLPLSRPTLRGTSVASRLIGTEQAVGGGDLESSTPSSHLRKTYLRQV